MTRPAPVDEEERLARLALARVVEPGNRAVARALESSSAVQVWHELRQGSGPAGLGRQAREGVLARAAAYDPRRDLDRLAAVGGRLVCPGDEEWPQGLHWPVEAMTSDVRELAAPWALMVRGPHPLAATLERSVSLVGARAATPYGGHVAAELGCGLAEAGWAVVSGGAYGIDAAAHQGALAAAGAPTVAVLACGPDVAYPRQHERLLGRIAQEGLVVSEVPPGSAPTRVRFLVRNRLIAALTPGTVVVEAAHRSGSLSTAARARDLSRHVMAVPGPVTSALSAGCHSLLREGAVCVTTAEEVLEVVGGIGEHLPERGRGRVDPRDGLSEETRRVLDAVPVRSPAGVAGIARSAGSSVLFVTQVLPALLVAGLVEQVDGAWRLTALGAGRVVP
jgi:DNA processing protein